MVKKIKFLSLNVLSSDYRKCQPDDFRCGNGTPDREHCLPKEKKCDGYYDCRNKKDEQDCPNNTNPPCRLDQFRCNTTHRCIDQTMRCNHKDDCGDGSDEEHCSTLTTSLRFKKLRV